MSVGRPKAIRNVVAAEKRESRTKPRPKRRWRPKKLLAALGCLYLTGLFAYGEVQNLALARTESALERALVQKERQNALLRKDIALLRENGVTAELAGVRLHLTGPGVVPVRVVTVRR